MKTVEGIKHISEGYQTGPGRHTDKSRSSRYRDIGNLAVAIAISGK